MTNVELKAGTEYYKTFISKIESALEVHVIMRKGATDTTSECSKKLAFDLGSRPQAPLLPAECNNGNMPFINVIKVKEKSAPHLSAIFTAQDHDFNAIMNTNHTLIFDVAGGTITMIGTNPNRATD